MLKNLEKKFLFRRGLEAVAHMMMNSGPEDITVALVHKFSNFTSLRALENHKACFPGYREFGKVKNSFFKKYIFSYKNI